MREPKAAGAPMRAIVRRAGPLRMSSRVGVLKCIRGEYRAERLMSPTRRAVSDRLARVQFHQCGQRITAERAEDAEKAGSLNETSTPHDEPWNDARWRQMAPEHSSWFSSGPCPSPRNSARSAVETACGQPITAEDAEKAESLNETSTPNDEPWNDARWRQNTGSGPHRLHSFSP
jgi:hypothetical protein